MPARIFRRAFGAVLIALPFVFILSVCVWAIGGVGAFGVVLGVLVLTGCLILGTRLFDS